MPTQKAIDLIDESAEISSYGRKYSTTLKMNRPTNVILCPRLEIPLASSSIRFSVGVVPSIEAVSGAGLEGMAEALEGLKTISGSLRAMIGDSAGTLSRGREDFVRKM